jgi:hypothetical protein
MKKLIVTLLINLVVANLNAQYPKLIVRFTDKAGNSFSLNNPSQFLSQRAIARRSRYNIAIDSADLPITTSYIDSVRLAGDVMVLSESKWLNQILIETTDPKAISKIESFPFVKMTKPIGFRVAETPLRDKFNETNSPLNFSANRNQQTANNYYDYGSNYNQVHMHEGEYLHNKGYHGETMQITVLDAGFYHYKSITAFDSIRINGQVLDERDFVAFDNSVNEDDTHGMQCLSILSANWPGRMIGTAPKANYWLVRTENSASEYPIEEHNWVVGAEFADSSGSDMISSSLGYNTFDDPSFDHSYNDFYKNATTVSQGAAMAVKKGMIVTNSAGNEGSNNWKYLIFPADADSVCAVGAVNNSGTIASFSSFGYPGKVKPNIVSVGAGTVIAGVNNQPVMGNGTSYSNPNIAGLIACLWQAFPSFNNMKILDAVYKSANKYNNPDDRYGYGIPNFRLAYKLLKHDQNVAIYGNDWLFATPNPFTSTIDAGFVSQADGPVSLQLIDAFGQVIASQKFTAEKEEVYHNTFSNLSNLPAGIYSLRYSDSSTSKTIIVQKGNLFEKDWIVAVPNPFSTSLTVLVKAPETGEINIRLLDAKGSMVDVVTQQVTQNQPNSIRFVNTGKLARGVYFVEYMGKTQKRVIRLLKI